MTGLRVQIVCQNWQEDRIIPRMARALSERLGWELVAQADPSTCDVLYLSAYFEAQKLREWPSVPVAAYFTHREEEPLGNAKARLYDSVAERVQLRIATCALYALPLLAAHGATVQVAAPLERDRFVIADREQNKRPVVGFSGYTYSNHRKGEDLVRGLLDTETAKRCDWRASGRGWPVSTKRYTWEQMPTFYQGLDVLVIPSRVEGIPMPPLEALACGVSVVIPRGVGLLDELPELRGIHRYDKGDLDTLEQALGAALDERAAVDRDALRQVTAPYSIEAWVRDHAETFEQHFGQDSAGIVTDADERACSKIEIAEPIGRDTDSTRGIYCVAFGQSARDAAENMMQSAKLHMPDVPICLCAAAPIGVEDVFIEQPDSDIGGRRAKLRAYELAPAEWQTVLYLDADTEVIAPIYQLFEWAEDGWDLVICKDIPPNDVLGHIKAKVIAPEAEETQRVVGTWDVLQLNGGVWAFTRNDDTAAFFAGWRREWERWAQRDQGALIRALYTHPLKMLVLGNEWNAFPKFQPNQESAGILHYPGEARRWTGQIRGRLDDAAAWQAVQRFENRRGRA